MKSYSAAAMMLVVAFAAVEAYGLGILTPKWVKNVTAETGLYETVLGGLNYEDIDGDGTVDILLPRRKPEDRIVCLSGKDGSIQWVYPPLDQDSLPGDPMCVPAIDDLEGDGNLEVILVGRNNWVHCITGRGQLKWKIDTDAGTDESATIFDLDGDGQKEVIWATGGPGYVYVANSDGTVRWKYEMGHGTNSGPTVWDVDRDGDPEVIVPDSDGNTIFCLSNKGVEKWRFATGDKCGQVNAAVGDIDKDGEYEILVLVPDEKRVYCLAFYGIEKWRFDLAADATLVPESLTIGDVDGDGYLETIVSDFSASGPHTYCVAFDGTLKWTAAAYTPSSMIGDFDGDGTMEVVGPRGYTQLIVLDGPTGEMDWVWDQAEVDPNIPVDPTFGVPLWGPGDVGQIMGDFDGDGKTEFAFECDPDNQVYCFTADGPYDPEKMIWPRPLKTAGNVPVIPMAEGLLLPLTILASLLGIRKIVL